MRYVTTMIAVLVLAGMACAHGFPPPFPPAPPEPPLPPPLAAMQPCIVLPWEPPQPCGCALSANVLVFDDGQAAGLGAVDPTADACALLQLNCTSTSSLQQFAALLGSGAIYDLVVFMNLSADVPTASDLAALDAYLTGVGPGSPVQPKLIFHSQHAITSRMSSSLFASMGVSLNSALQPLRLSPCQHIVAGDPLLAGLPSPFSFSSPGGIGLVDATPLPGAVTAHVQSSSAASPTLLIRADRHAAFVGFPPHLVAPRPQAASAWLGNLMARMLAPTASGGLSIDSVTLHPGSAVPIGGQVVVDVVVRNSLATQQTARVDLYCGYLKPVPLLPAAPSPYATAVTIPAGGTATVVFGSLPTALVEECWRVHAVVNGDLAVSECDLADNVKSGGLCVMDAGGPCAAALGDCNADSVRDIRDSLAMAQIGAHIAVPGAMPCSCDVDLDSRLTVLDALVMARVAAGLAVLPPAPPRLGAPAPSITALPLVDLGNAHLWELDICATSPVQLFFYFRQSGSMIWRFAHEQTCSPIDGIDIDVPPAIQMYFAWDSRLDVPVRPAAVDLRVVVSDPSAGTSTVHAVTGITLN